MNLLKTEIAKKMDNLEALFGRGRSSKLFPFGKAPYKRFPNFSSAASSHSLKRKKYKLNNILNIGY